MSWWSDVAGAIGDQIETTGENIVDAIGGGSASSNNSANPNTTPSATPVQDGTGQTTSLQANQATGGNQTPGGTGTLSLDANTMKIGGGVLAVLLLVVLFK